MRILFTTGIYLPDIGGVATYTSELMKGLRAHGHEVTVVTYSGEMFNTTTAAASAETSGKWGMDNDGIVRVPRTGNFFARWWRYAKALRKYGKDADVVIAFSSVSTGIPLILSRLKKPKRILRLGGDFFWERYTDAGGMKSLREWYGSGTGLWKFLNIMLMDGILNAFDRVVYSTEFQRKIHEGYFFLNNTSVIENAAEAALSFVGQEYSCPTKERGRNIPAPLQPEERRVFRLLVLSRFVGFKNLHALIDAMPKLPDVILTMVGEGLEKDSLQKRIQELSLSERVRFLPPVHGAEKEKIFQDHDLLVIPSITEISPNAALEARASGLPVLLTKETGLSENLIKGMVIAPLRTMEEIAAAVTDVKNRYDSIVREASAASSHRRWEEVTSEWNSLLESL